MNTRDPREPPEQASAPGTREGPDSPHPSLPTKGSPPPDGLAAPDTECARSQQRAPELALGVLCGRERAEMLVHLQQCGRCQDRVSQLAVTAERLIELVPEVEPSPGFEHRVLAAIAAASGPAPDEPATDELDPDERLELPSEGPGA